MIIVIIIIKEVQKIISFPTEEIRKANFDTVSDQLGWHEQGDGKLFVGIHVAQGRIKDNETIETVLTKFIERKLSLIQMMQIQDLWILMII